jgi:GT2 family glycosyltransferase
VTAESGREAVSVIVPFAGNADDARATLLALQRIAFGPTDEAIVVDNSAASVFATLEHPQPIRIVVATKEPSSFYARNVGAEHAKNEWFLFIDSDCLPPSSLLDDYFVDGIAEDVGAVAGAVLPADVAMGLLGSYKSFRRHLDQSKSMGSKKPSAATANLLVRRTAWAELGGFSEGIRSGGDIDFCWRLSAAGWKLAYEPRAEIRHLHRDTFKAHAAQQIRYGGAHLWLRRRYPETRKSRPLAIQLPLSTAGAVRRAAVGDWQWSLFHLLDGLTAVLLSVGKLRGNRAARSTSGSTATVVVASWPDASAEDPRIVVTKAVEKSEGVRVEARHRPVRVARSAMNELPADYMEDDSPLDALRGVAWLVLRRPRQTTRSVLRKKNRVDLGTLTRLAPAARRMAQSGGHHVHALDTPSASDARALADLIGATFTTGDGAVVSVDMERLSRSSP